MPTNVEIPSMGESIREAILIKWHKSDGETVKKDEPLAELETDKANVDIPSPGSGVLRRLREQGTTVQVGEAIGRIDDAGVAGAAPSAPAPTAQVVSAPTAQPGSTVAGSESKPAIPVADASSGALDDLSPAVRRLVEENKLDPAQITGTGPGNRLTKEDVTRHLESNKSAPPAEAVPEVDHIPTPVKALPPATTPRPESPATAPTPPPAGPVLGFDADGTRRTPMSKMRLAIGRRLIEAQQTAAILTTFNEVDLTEVMAIRSRYKEQFEKTHGVGLGFMSFFARAIVLGLKEFPHINAFIDGSDVIYHNYLHLGIAVSTDRGLAVPVLRNVQEMSFAKIESEIKRLATSARDGKLSLAELSGGTFTITNGGVFGSLLSTPILTPPQSGILGMHTIQKRPMVVNDKIEIRSMMYVALSYDHRLVDGKESVSFLVRVKQMLEDPARLMLEV